MRPPPATRRYDPTCDPTRDPLLAPDPGQGPAHARTGWVASAGTLPEDDGPVYRDQDVGVAIIGSGATGLANALPLAREQDLRAVVQDAKRAAWGRSSRGSGQRQNPSGQLKRSQCIERSGLDMAKQLGAKNCAPTPS
jgi:hypothetical protein